MSASHMRRKVVAVALQFAAGAVLAQSTEDRNVFSAPGPATIAPAAVAEAQLWAQTARELNERKSPSLTIRQERQPIPAQPSPAEAERLRQQAMALEKEGRAKDAVRLYRSAARASNGPAARRLGEIFSCSVPGVPRDYAESLQWYEVARGLGEKNLPAPNSVAHGCPGK
jgi:serine/threonine-protein kinase